MNYKNVKRAEFKRQVLKQGFSWDDRRGKGSHAQLRVNGVKFTCPIAKVVEPYVLRQAAKAGMDMSWLSR